MATVPNIETALLEVLQALDLDELQSKQKIRFKKRQKTFDDHSKMMIEVFWDIIRELNLDSLAKDDVLSALLELGTFQGQFENSVWTFGADRRQVLWYTLSYTWMPFLGRKFAFWQLDEIMDADMPGGKFWYLPQATDHDGVSSLHMPVANVLDWFFDLCGISMNKMSELLGRGYGEETRKDYDTPAGIESNLHKWRSGTMPRAKNIDSMFHDKCEIPFSGTFTIEVGLKLTDKLEAAKQFIKSKGLTIDELSKEIPMTSLVAIEQVLVGHADEVIVKHFIDLLTIRYAKPSMQTVRNRLHIARAVQHGYRKLVKNLCPEVKETCSDPSKNKVLQLLNIYRTVYNLTIQAHVECSTLEDENIWFEDRLPIWHKTELFCSILPSLNAEGRNQANSVATILSEHFVDFLGGEELEDLFEWDEDSESIIAERNLFRFKKDIGREDAVQKLKKKIKFGSPLRTLQKQDNYQVIRSLLKGETTPHRVRQLAINRMREVATTPIQEIGVILDELDIHINMANKQRSKNCCKIVDDIIVELESHSSVELVQAELLQHKAKHALFQNDFESAESYFREALEKCNDQNRGDIRGQIARDLFALSVANQRLIPENHEKYFRHALFSGIFDENDPSKVSIEDAAVVAAKYFWDNLYRPYPGFKKTIPLNEEQVKHQLSKLITLCSAGELAQIDEWAKKNPSFKDQRLRDVRGDTFISCILKMVYELRKKYSNVGIFLPESTMGENKHFEKLLSNFLLALKLLAELWPTLLNLADFKAQTPLMIAANNGDVEMVETFLSAGADPNLQDFKGRTALFSAVAARSVECVGLILDSGVDISLKTIDDNTVLHTAVRSGHPQIANLLISCDVSFVESRNSYGLTPVVLLDGILNNYKVHVHAMSQQGRSVGEVDDYLMIRKFLSV